MLSLQFTIDIKEVYCLSGSKTMKMLSQSLFYLERRFGMIMDGLLFSSMIIRLFLIYPSLPSNSLVNVPWVLGDSPFCR
jgi:hypothetical protein